MKRTILIFTAMIGGLIFVSCEKNKADNDTLKPRIIFQHEAYQAEINIPITLSPEIVNPGKEIAYKWRTGDKLVSEEKSLTFTPSEMKDYTILLSVTNEFGETSAQCVVKTLPISGYRNAVFMIEPGARGDNLGPGNASERVNARLMAIKADGSYVDDAFGEANEGKKLGYHCVQPVIHHNKIYILSDAGIDDFNKAELVIADAGTLKVEKAIQIEKGNDKVTSLTIVGDEQAYVGTGDQKLFPLNLRTGQKGEYVQGLAKNFSGNILTPIIPINNKIYGVSSESFSSAICAINPETQEVSSVPIDDPIKIMLPEADGRLVLITEGLLDWGGKTVSIYSTLTNAIEGKEQTLPDDVFASAAIHPEAKDLYFYSKKQNGEVYKYNYQTGKSTFFTSVDDVQFPRLYVDNKANKLYYTYKLRSALKTFKTRVYDLSAGADPSPLNEGYEHTGVEIYYAISY